MTIVVAYSPDQYGRAALAHGAAEATLRSEGLLVINDTRGDSLVDTRFAHEDEITQVRVRLATLGLQAEVRQEVVRDVAESVVRAATESGASLIVVGVRHRSPVGKALMGSVAQRVILDAPCPVLAVKPDEESDAV
ncbi:universal stress protein [Aeromicrobium tamlense]|uniref:Nucleotide-binding universal stress UspA family protein n=1 Tax=Aeromicrobium tamlense TaxID=375541 RepID=A0A8I0KPX1_9ACTN|nr:universal stress protein [Aeromicrobium tamlense]MBD1272304.1 universal stress protein [Aeromicrobium tamlense]NYI38499.1 nucleotide-binding universal stress UspA family protein [Aeromicrobium tamlense]